MAKTAKTITLVITPEERDLIVEALDSHRYWQLADEQYRNNGEVYDKSGEDGNMKGSDDSETQRKIDATYALQDRLQEG